MTGERDGAFEMEILDMELDLCLCGRDPGSAEVRAELLKVMALQLRFGLVLGGCLRDAATAYNAILAELVPVEARELERFLVEIRQSLDAIEAHMSYDDHPASHGARLH